MVAGGKISAAEAATMLAGGQEEAQAPAEAVTKETETVPAEMTAPASALPEKAATGDGPSWLRIRVNDMASGRNKVSVNIPLRMMKAGLELGGSFAPGLRRFDWERLSSSLAETEGGLLVEVQDEEDGEHVRIFVE